MDEFGASPKNDRIGMVSKRYHTTVIAHLYTSRLYNTHYITERNSIALAWASPHLQRS